MSAVVIMSVDEKFKAACDQIRKFSKRPPDPDMLEVYALYKQATVGDVNTPKPADAQAKQKWEAWLKKKGLNTTAAKEQYTEKIRTLAPKFE